MPLSVSSRVIAQRDVVSCEIGDGAALLDPRSNIYYGLNSVGSRTWELIQKQRSVSDICRILVTEYDVQPERCSEELLELLRQLAAAGLIETHD